MIAGGNYSSFRSNSRRVAQKETALSNWVMFTYAGVRRTRIWYCFQYGQLSGQSPIVSGSLLMLTGADRLVPMGDDFGDRSLLVHGNGHPDTHVSSHGLKLWSITSQSLFDFIVFSLKSKWQSSFAFCGNQRKSHVTREKGRKNLDFRRYQAFGRR